MHLFIAGLVALTALEGLAVGLGRFDNATAGYITAALGAVSGLVVFRLKTTDKPPKPPALVVVTPAPVVPPAPDTLLLAMLPAAA